MHNKCVKIEVINTKYNSFNASAIISHKQTPSNRIWRHSQGFWGTGEQGHFSLSGGQGYKGLKIRGTGEHRQCWGTGNIENQDLVFGEQGNNAIFSRETREEIPPPGGPQYAVFKLYILRLASTAPQTFNSLYFTKLSVQFVSSSWQVL